MRAVKIKSGENWQPLVPKYTHGGDFDFNNTITKSKEGISLNINSVTEKVVDTKHNNYTSTQLTSRSTLSNLVKPTINTSIYPIQTTSYILCRAYPNTGTDSRYLKIKRVLTTSSLREYIAGNDESDPNNSSWFVTQERDDNYIYFNITLHDENELSISHNDNINKTYLTHRGIALELDEYNSNDITYADMYFEAAPPGDVPSRFQRFKYYIEPKNGVMVLMARMQDTGELKYVALQPSGRFEFIDIPQGVSTFPPSSVLRFIPYIKSSHKLKVDNNWISYSTAGDQNNLNINTGKSYKDVFNNYLLTTQYSQITGSSIPVDITPLKNQLTSEYDQSRRYPFMDVRNCDLREYDKIFTGTNQVKGLNDIYLGYNEYTTSVVLEPDKITYFHTPQDMYPFDKININDSGLTESGATGGDTPIVSDKIFKKAADYKYSSPDGAPSDEETGIWLCSWLKNNVGSDWDSTVTYNTDVVINYEDSTYISLKNNTNIIPGTDNTVWVKTDSRSMWVDRYYNPNEFTETEALKIENQYSTYTSKFDFIVSTLSAEKHYVFDKISDLVFEPGCRYAYYKIGDKENQTIVDTLKSDLIHEGVEPTYNSDREEVIITEDSINFKDNNIYIQAKSKPYIDDSSFTISFWMSMQDWSEPVGAQIVGNYTNKGFGVFNKENTTPYITIPTASGTQLYNTDMTKLLPNGLDVNDGVSSSLGGNENVHTLHSTMDGWFIKQHDKKNLLVESTNLTERGIDPYDLLADMVVVQDNIFLLSYEVPGSNERVYNIDIHNEQPNLLYNNKPPVIKPPGVTDPMLLDTGRLALYRDELKIVYANTHTIDLSGNTWFLYEGDVYENIANPQLGVAASFDDRVDNDRVLIIAEEVVRGFSGNEINVTGDGSSTVSTLITNWNSSNSANRAQIILGGRVVPRSGENIQLSGGRDAKSSSTIKALECSQGHIVDIISDYYDNIFTLCSDGVLRSDLVTDGNTMKIYKLSNDRKIINEAKLVDIDSSLTMTTGEFYMDMICEFEGTEYIKNIIILHHQPGSEDFKLIKLNDNLQLVSNKTFKAPELANTILPRLKDITGFESNKHRFADTLTDNHMTFKLRLRNYFDSDKTSVSNLRYNVHDLSPGYHHFTYSFDSTTSNISLYVDGELVSVDTSDDANQAAAYKFTDTINSPIIIGATPFFNNVLFAEHLQKSTAYYSIDSQVKDIKIYNSSLNYFKVRALTKQHSETQPAILTLPAGGRTYLDQMTKFYKHRQPGSKSNHFNINIISPPALSGQQLKDQIEARLVDEMESHIPINSSINKINWI